MKLLLVEDDRNTLEYIQSAIDYRELGVDTVLTATDGQDALELYMDERPEIIISDIEMPRMNGITLMKEIRRQSEGMPEYIFLTCHDDFSYAQEAIHLGALDYLMKPLVLEEVRNVVIRAVERNRSRLREQEMKEAYLRYGGDPSELNGYTDMHSGQDRADADKKSISQTPAGERIVRPVVDASSIRYYVQTQKKMELIKQIRDELMGNTANGQESKAFLQMLHHIILQGVYSFLAEEGIDAATLLEEDTYRHLDSQAERSPVNIIKLTEYLYDTAIKGVEEKALSRGVIERVCRFIQENFRRNIGRDDIAEYVGFSRNYLSRMWNMSMSKPIREYINDCRVEEAKKLLDSTEKNVTEISIEVGYDSSAYFATVFKGRTGLTPIEYRNRKGS